MSAPFPEEFHLPHRPPVWREVGFRFSDDRACLASYLAFEAAEIVEGVKPANLVNIINREQPCGRNLYDLWNRCGEELLSESGLSTTILRRKPGSMLLLIHDRPALADLLGDRRVKAMLIRSGYRRTNDLDAILDELRERIGAVGFPHEIGIFLGYPLKDVAAFLGWCPIPFTCQGPWKIYGDPGKSLQLAERHRDCRRRMAWRVARSDDPLSCLRRAG